MMRTEEGGVGLESGRPRNERKDLPDCCGDDILLDGKISVDMEDGSSCDNTVFAWAAGWEEMWRRSIF